MPPSPPPHPSPLSPTRPRPRPELPPLLHLALGTLSPNAVYGSVTARLLDALNLAPGVGFGGRAGVGGGVGAVGGQGGGEGGAGIGGSTVGGGQGGEKAHVNGVNCLVIEGFEGRL